MNLLTLFSISYSFTIGLSESEYQLWEQNGNIYGEQYSTECLETDFSIDFNFWRFYIGGGVDITSHKKDNEFLLNAGGYSLLMCDYPYRAGYQGKFFNIGYEFRCIHPTMAYLQDRDIKRKKDGAYQRVFIQFSHELRFK